MSVAGAQPRQQHREPGLQHHEQGPAAAPAATSSEPTVQCRRRCAAATRSAWRWLASAGRAGPAGSSSSSGSPARASRQYVDLPRDDAVRVVLARRASPAATACSRRTAPAAASHSRRPAGRARPRRRAARSSHSGPMDHAVAGDVVHDNSSRVCSSGPRAEQRRRASAVLRRGRTCAGPPAAAPPEARSAADDAAGQDRGRTRGRCRARAGRGRRRSAGTWCAASRGGRTSPAAPLEGAGVEPPGEPHGVRDVVARSPGLELARGTTAAAGRRTAAAGPAARPGGAGTRAPRASVEPFGQLGEVSAPRTARASPVPRRRRLRIRLISRTASSEWPPRSKKSSSTPTRSTPEDLGEQSAQDLLPGVARGAARGRRARLGRGQRPPVELAVRRQRQRVEHHERRRHHVVGQLARQRAPHAPRRRSGGRRGGHDVGDQPPVARTVLPRDHRGLRDAGGRPGRPRSRRARCGTPRIFTWSSAGPGTPARRRRSTAPRRRCGTSARPAAERVGHEALRGQAAAVQVAAGQLHAGEVQLARDAHRHRRQRVVEHVHAGVPHRAADRHAVRHGRRTRP